MLESVSLIVISYSRVFNKDSKWGLKAGEIFICIYYNYVQAGILYKSGNPDVAVRLNSITKSNKKFDFICLLLARIKQQSADLY